jgi:UDP-N-acetylmuramate--alanine ligase
MALPDQSDPPPSAADKTLRDRRIHFVGIGGCGMSGIARMCQQAGAICTGSDRSPSSATSQLQGAGIPVVFEQYTKTMPKDCQLMVISAAIAPDHPEPVEAARRGVEVVKYAHMLGRLMRGQTGVAIAGTHGKSTTTSMLSHILIACGLDPSFILGANCNQIGGGSRTGNSNILVAEACEYDRSFHHLHPVHALILNVEADHMDVYENLDEIVEAFTVFAGKVPAQGSLLINHEMPCRLDITATLACPVETIGFTYQADWRVGIKAGQTRLRHNGKAVAQWRNPLPGDHMAYNAAAAAITAHRLGANWNDIANAITQFAGLDRRMQLIGIRSVGTQPSDPRITIIDDYGHHPTEIDTTLRALRQHYQPKRLICVFQPHQHSRTRFLLDQFAVSFSQADIVIVPPIYFVRDSEAERHTVNASDLVERLQKKNVTAMHLDPFAAIIEKLQEITRPGDLIVTMGAGNVWQIAHNFLIAGG